MKLIFWFIACFLSTFGITYFFYKLVGCKNKIDFKVLLIFILGISCEAIIKCHNLTLFSVISYFVFYPILFYRVSNLHFKKAVYYSIFIWVFGVMLDFVFMLTISLLSYLVHIDIYNYSFKIIPTIISFLMFVSISHMSFVLKKINQLINFLYDVEYFNFCLAIFSIFTFSVGISILLNINNINVNGLLFILAILVVIIFILLLQIKINSFENKKYLDMLKQNNEFYMKMDDENRIFKHNLIAKLSSIKSVSNKKAIALIDDFVIKNNKGMNYSKKMKTIPYGLNGIIYQKTYPYLEEINFKLTNKINIDIFKVLKPRRYNVLVEKLIVSLDNAIEASLNSKNKVVVINLYDDENNIYVEIKNSFAHNLDIDNLGKLNYSTKGKQRGLGLFSILRDNEASLKVRVVNNYFISIITARKQK